MTLLLICKVRYKHAFATTAVPAHGIGGKSAMRRRRERQLAVAGPYEFLNLKLSVNATHAPSYYSW
jgi:hypothetical protein